MSGWSSHATIYDKYFSPILQLYCKDMLVLASQALETITSSNSNLTIHDVACGSGAMIAELISSVPSARIIASDFASGMLDICKEKFGDRIERYCVDGQTLIGTPTDVDVITSSFGIALFPNIKNHRSDGLNAAFRVLKPGGVLIASSWVSDCEYLRFLDHFAKARNRELKFNVCFKVTGFQKCVEKSGFVDFKFYESSHSMVFKSGLDFMNALLDNPFFISVVTELGRDRIHDISAEFFGKDTSDFLSQPLAFESKAIILIATKP